MYGRKVYHSVTDPGFPRCGAPTLGGGGRGGAPTYEFSKFSQKLLETRLHSSRMHTARLLTVSPSMHWAGGGGGWVSLPGGSPCQNGGLPCQGGILARRVCLARGGVCLARGGVCLASWGGSPCQGGACLSGGCLLARGDGIPAYTEADPTCGQNSWHILKILPCPKLCLRAVIKEFGSGGCVPRAPP